MKTIFECGFFLFPYECIKKGESIAIYGYGKVGQQYYQQIKNNNYCNVKYIVDKNTQDIKCEEDVVICGAEEFFCDEELKVVISVTNTKAVSDIYLFLKDIGYCEDNIIHVIHRLSVKHSIDRSFGGKYTEFLNFKEALKKYGKSFFLYWSKINELLMVYRTPQEKFVRVGRENDGGYVMYDDFSDAKNKIAYSFGICDDVSWDKDIAEHGYQVYMYDHTIEALPYELEQFHFFKEGISESNISEKNKNTLKNFLIKNGHNNSNNMLLKMDVEGAEYGFLKNSDIEVLKRFNQIVMEVHDINVSKDKDLIVSSLEKLISEFYVIHIHPNNFSSAIYVDNMVYPNTLEITLLNKKYYNCFIDEKNEIRLPRELDMPCDSMTEDILLGNWNKRG